MNSITGQKLSKGEENWNSIINELVLVDNLKVLYATIVKYTHFQMYIGYL